MFREDLLFKDLSYKIVGLCIEVHKELGRYAKEKQCADLLEKKLKAAGLEYKREVIIGDSGNIIDYEIDGKIVIELKAVPFLLPSHYDQVKRYLHQTGLQLGILINFREQRIKSKRILNPNNPRSFSRN